MRGFSSVFRRITMATFALGLTFGIPNEGRAQTPQLQTARLPWQTPAIISRPAPFDSGWTRVLSETQLVIRRFAATYPFNDVLTIDSIVRTDTHGVLWVPNVSTYVPPAPQQASIDVGTIRATLTPVEFASDVAAESRTMQGVLAGVQFEMVD
jgi:hypothetical protein